MASGSWTSIPDTGSIAAPAPDISTILLAVAPFIIFLLVLWWGSRKKARKKITIEMAYNLIALQLLVFLFLPLCELPFECGVWALIPIAMFAGLVAFVYYRMSKEAQHHMRVIKAIQEGHIGYAEVLQGQIEEEIAEAERKAGSTGSGEGTEKTMAKEPEGTAGERKKPATEEIPDDGPEISREHPEHKKIERIILKVLKKKGAIRKSTTSKKSRKKSGK